MQEAERRMIQDDVIADDLLQIVSSEDFPRPRGEQAVEDWASHPPYDCTYIII